MAEPWSANPQTEEDFIARLKAGDEDAFKSIYTHFSSQLYLFAYKQISDSQESEDIVSKAFISLHGNIQKYSTVLHIRNSLYVSVSNMCSSFRRNRLVRKRKLRSMYSGEVQSPILTEIIYNEFINELYQLVKKLPEDQKSIIEKLVTEGKSVTEIANELQISVNNVRVKHHRALLFLRALAVVQKIKSGITIII
ncbi:sigma-70 family RNA polymerase sigma factor [Paraflavitalea sp. CAU 1676]|uniref:RNA polymerase sigma factor n=1 Tax=Paraflavitalea sp. CAU 1676 TaxID=3032598 RepID=UPI0023DAC64D|nr:sigma-70 family RNA polymerase sigma factor [Paraflavitalea sp. CAU 1676]MDF2190528.1 sigma-70 family RNA polymerase sigma factor [Paraflavitalea sp. CAU 1676]